MNPDGSAPERGPQPFLRLIKAAMRQRLASRLRRPDSAARARRRESQLPQRNGAVASAVLVHLAWTGPLRLALAGATRSGTAGVGYPLAISRRSYAASTETL